MAFIFDSVDKDAQKNGIWEDFSGGKFLIASTSTSKYQSRLNTLRKPLARQIDNGTVNPDDLTNMLCQAMSECVLLDWDGVATGNGTKVEYSRDNAKELLVNNEAFRDFVIEVASNQALYEKEFKDATVKK